MAAHAGTASDTILALVLAGLSLLGTIYVQMTHNDRDNAQRISAIEAHQGDTGKRLDRMESKLDRLIEWALGTKP